MTQAVEHSAHLTAWRAEGFDLAFLVGTFQWKVIL
jgi:hypothetical protein